MDFGKFRLGGELSDIEVVIGDKHFQLHRFPLYTRSNFFLKEFAKLGSQKIINLDKFPGGCQAFTAIADFCYNISVDITVENVISIRCGAKYLEMNGSGNLYEKTGVYIEEIMNNGRRGKNLQRVVSLLATIPEYQMEEITNHTLEQGISALTHYWNKSQYGMAIIEEVIKPEIQTILHGMEFEFFLKLIRACNEKTRNTDVINALVSEYIIYSINNNSITSNDSCSTDEDCSKDEPNGVQNGQSELTNGHLPRQESTTPETNVTVVLSETTLNVIERLLDVIQPNLSTLSHNMAGKWLKPLLEAYSKTDGNDEILGRIIAFMANELDENCLALMTEKALTSFSDKVDQEGLSERTKLLVTDHLAKQAEINQLTAKAFIAIMKKLSLHKTQSQDNLLNIIVALSTKGR